MAYWSSQEGAGVSYFPYILLNEIQTMFSQLAEAIIKGLARGFVYWSFASRNKTKINGFEKDQKHDDQKLPDIVCDLLFFYTICLCRVWNMQHIAAYSWRIRTAEAMESSSVLMQT